MPGLRWHASSVAAPASSSALRWHASSGAGAIPSSPTLRWHASTVAGGVSVIVRPLTGATVDAGALIPVTVGLSDGTLPDSWAWRQISGPTVTVFGTGQTVTFTAPHTIAGGSVVLGVRATRGAVQSSEVTVTYDVRAHSNWYLTGPGVWKPLLTGAPSGPRPLKIAMIGDSTLWQDGNGESRLRALLTANGWTSVNIFYYARIGKAIGYADDQGFTTLVNMAQARAAIGEPDVWLLNEGSNGHRDGDAKNVGWINAVLDAAGAGKVIWVGISQVTGYNAGASTEATRTHWNDIAKPVVQAHAGAVWLDWHAYVKAYAGGDSTFWAADGVHMSTTGYTVKNAYIAGAIGSGISA